MNGEALGVRIAALSCGRSVGHGACGLAAREAGYAENHWATFKQRSEKGARASKGAKATPVIWFKKLECKGDGADDEDSRHARCVRLSWVFNSARSMAASPRRALAQGQPNLPDSSWPMR
ncbi:MULTISPECIES: ArdC-like ssDNA-binding domain-containing protein [unclassified Ensifer]|uniref:ArdC-like ssDNA-binding domain-containing protein n=1 Tax=Ensifer sp. LC163 TaxID=1120652 RepID=UPI00081340AB|nr:hypothetical protein BC361_19720 [Ensifer sp. LC54]OCP25827.1 hypothetical protein BC363_18815 [Ensifer sp. LC384]OCP35958.1 hypothetical protein BC360_26495 [Ensifer sp. LC163]